MFPSGDLIQSIQNIFKIICGNVYFLGANEITSNIKINKKRIIFISNFRTPGCLRVNITYQILLYCVFIVLYLIVYLTYCIAQYLYYIISCVISLTQHTVLQLYCAVQYCIESYRIVSSFYIISHLIDLYRIISVYLLYCILHYVFILLYYIFIL